MVDGKHSVIYVKGRGSQELNDKLLRGDLQLIADAFDENYSKVRSIIVGKHFGDLNIVRCAEALVAYYDEVKLKNKVKQIIDEHAA